MRRGALGSPRDYGDFQLLVLVDSEREAEPLGLFTQGSPQVEAERCQQRKVRRAVQLPRDLGVGSPVRVYYHPQRPSLAVLYPGILTATTITITAMLTLGAAAILGWLGLGISSLIGRSR